MSPDCRDPRWKSTGGKQADKKGITCYTLSYLQGFILSSRALSKKEDKLDIIKLRSALRMRI